MDSTYLHNLISEQGTCLLDPIERCPKSFPRSKNTYLRNNYFHWETLGQETDPPVFRVRRVPASNYKLNLIYII